MWKSKEGNQSRPSRSAFFMGRKGRSRLRRKTAPFRRKMRGAGAGSRLPVPSKRLKEGWFLSYALPLDIKIDRF